MDRIGPTDWIPKLVDCDIYARRAGRCREKTAPYFHAFDDAEAEWYPAPEVA